MSARPECFLNDANPGGPSKTEAEATMLRRIRNNCCVECGRPAHVKLDNKLGWAWAELSCSHCHWSRVVKKGTHAYKLATITAEMNHRG